MTKDVDQTLVLEILKKIQTDISELKDMRNEMREGFASIKSHITGLIGDVFSHERRILNIEDEIMRIRNSLEKRD